MYTVIGLDGGGTSTKGCIGSSSIDIKGTSISGGLNPFVYDVNEIKETLLDSIRQLTSISNISVNKVDMIVIGGAGLDRELDQRRFKEIYNATGMEIPLFLTNDAKTFLHANIGDDAGILTISGTGSIAYGYGDNTYYRQGGFGHLISDEGSGYDIGLSGIKEIFNARDKGIESEIEGIVLDYLGLMNRDYLLSWIYNDNTRKQDIAKITTVLVSQGMDTDTVRGILRKATDDLINLTSSLYSKMSNENVKPKIFVTNGSVFEKISYVRDRYIKEIESCTGMRYSSGKLSAEIGALMLGIKKIKGDI